MAINITKSLVAVGVGGADIGLEYLDKNQGWSKTFQNAQDVGRLLAVAGGIVVQLYMPKYAGAAEVVQYAATPLLMQSIPVAVDQQMNKAPAAKDFVGRRTGNWVHNDNAPGGGYRPST